MSALRPSPSDMVSIDMPDVLAAKFEQWLSLHRFMLVETPLDPAPEIPNYTVVPTRELWDEVVARDSAPVTATDAHVSYVPGEDPQTAALREMVNDNREKLGIDGEGGEEER